MSGLIQQVVEVLGPVLGGLAGGALAETGGDLSKATLEQVRRQFRGKVPRTEAELRRALEANSDLLRNLVDILQIDQTVTSNVENTFNGPITFNGNSKLVAGTNVEHGDRT